MKLSKNINNNFDSIFEKKSSQSIENSKEIVKERVFYEKILEKTVSFRNDLLEKPKLILKSLFDKKINIPLMKVLLVSSVFVTTLYLNPSNMNFFEFSIFLIMQCSSTIMLIIGLLEICFFRISKKNVNNSIDDISTVDSLLSTTNNISRKIQGYMLSSLFYKNKEEFENSLNSVNNYRNFTEENLNLFLQSFNKEEIAFISEFLLERFNEEAIEATVLDDLASFLENKLIKENTVNKILTKENKFKSFMSKYIETEEVSNKKLLKSLL